MAREKLTICEDTRKAAAASLFVSLEKLLSTKKNFSEVDVRDRWLAEMRKNDALYHSGWYIPPPDGIGVLVGTEDQQSRNNYESLRPEPMWPKDSFVYDANHPLLYVYASPVSKQSGLIGDFGMTIYRGNRSDIKDHLQKCLSMNYRIFDHVEPGMTFAEVYNFAVNEFEREGLRNQITSITDPAAVNIGHTVPASYEDWTLEEKKIFDVCQQDDAQWPKAAEVIKNKRKFFNGVEQTKFSRGMAVTLEPRLVITNNQNIPMASYHTIIIINPDGSKKLLTNFNDIFRSMGMEYMSGIIRT